MGLKVVNFANISCILILTPVNWKKYSKYLPIITHFTQFNPFSKNADHYTLWLFKAFYFKGNVGQATTPLEVPEKGGLWDQPCHIGQKQHTTFHQNRTKRGNNGFWRLNSEITLQLYFFLHLPLPSKQMSSKFDKKNQNNSF